MFIICIILINFFFSVFLMGAQKAHIEQYRVRLEKAFEKIPSHNDHAITEYTLPDLHGNSVKLLKALQVLKCINVSKKKFKTIIEHYNTRLEDISAKHLEKIKAAIQSIQITQWGKTACVRLIGDEFSDRGNNDYYTLLMIEHFIKNGLNMEFILSNHGFDFIRSYEDQTFYPSMGAYFAQSLCHMHTLLLKRMINHAEVNRIISWYYKANIKIISYSLTLDANEIYLYTHAPVGLRNIEDIANALNVEYNETSILGLCASIDRINDKFLEEFVFPNKVRSIYPNLLFITNNRDINDLKRPCFHNGYKIFFVHGHEDTGATEPHVFNLEHNNLLGKTEEENTGILNIFKFKGIYTHSKSFCEL